MNYELREQAVKIFLYPIKQEIWQAPFKPMYEETFRQARLMEKNRLAAARIRIRYLIESINDFVEDKSGCGTEWAKDCYDEIIWLLERAYWEPYEQAKPGQPDRITETMKEIARDYPVECLVEFKHGKALAWCHNDHTPSLYLAKRMNFVCCPVCDKRFNPIEILQTRDNFTYYEAVRFLQ